jgi:hypothetical protein
MLAERAFVGDYLSKRLSVAPLTGVYALFLGFRHVRRATDGGRCGLDQALKRCLKFCRRLSGMVVLETARREPFGYISTPLSECWGTPSAKPKRARELIYL